MALDIGHWVYMYLECFLQLTCSSTSQIRPIECQSTLNISMTHFFVLHKLWKLPWTVQNNNKPWNITTLRLVERGFDLLWIFLKRVRQFLHSKITSVYCNKSAFSVVNFNPQTAGSSYKQSFEEPWPQHAASGKYFKIIPSEKLTTSGA